MAVSAVTLPAFFIDTGRVGGAEQMFYNLARGFSANGVLAYLYFSKRGHYDSDFVAEASQFSSIRLKRVVVPANRFAAEQYFSQRWAKNCEHVVFPNYFTPVTFNQERITTIVHDLLFKDHPSLFSPLKRAWQEIALRATLYGGGQIVAISEFTAHSIERHFGGKVAAKVRVVPNPVYWPEADAIERPLSEPYLFCAASQYPHKNLLTLLRAFIMLSRKNREIKLVMTGQSSERLRGHMRAVDLQKEISDLGSQLQITGYISSREVVRYMRHAEMLVHPSQYEGFGLPVAEALGWGVPVLTTDCAALPETSLGFAYHVPGNAVPEVWAEAIENILRNRSAFIPDTNQIQLVRDTYEPSRIARMYMERS